jgi:glycosyltransferase involved in cell wall biosynthesis
MRIGVLAPIWERIPPIGYGGIELVVDHLTRHLLARGHQVTLFAAGDAETEAEHVWTEPKSLRAQGFDTWSCQTAEVIHVANAIKRHRQFDVYHNHLGPVGVAIAEAAGAPTITTLHGPLLPENKRFFSAHPHHPYVSISNAQRDGCLALNYAATIYNGIETSEYRPERKQDYLLFLGRISPEKGIHLAIDVAQRAGLPLIIAAKVDPFDREFYERDIAPRIDGDMIRFIGEVHGKQKQTLLARARALLHLVQWNEPFGLVMAEAMASGTPVIAMPAGSIPEVITHGKTGFIVTSVDEAVAAIDCLGAIDPDVCRDEAIRRFDVVRMVDEYEALFLRFHELSTHSAPPAEAA